MSALILAAALFSVPQEPLPGLSDKSESVLSHVIRRVKKSKRIDSIIVATTSEPEDDMIVREADKYQAKKYRGSKENVLERYYEAASAHKLDLIVRVTSDCPCIDPELIDHGIDEHIRQKADFSSTALERTLPYGLDFEIMSFETLEKTFKGATKYFEKEHVTPFIYKSNPDKFKIHKLVFDTPSPSFRVTLDTPEDYTLICAVYTLMNRTSPDFNLKDLSTLFGKHAWLSGINENIEQKKVYSDLSEELEEITKYCEKQDLHRFSDFVKKYGNSIIDKGFDQEV